MEYVRTEHTWIVICTKMHAFVPINNYMYTFNPVLCLVSPWISFMLILSCAVKPELQKGPQWRKVASRGDGTATAEVVCQAEGIPRVDFTWEKKGVLMDFANPRLERKHYFIWNPFLAIIFIINVGATVCIWLCRWIFTITLGCTIIYYFAISC